MFQYSQTEDEENEQNKYKIDKKRARDYQPTENKFVNRIQQYLNR